MNPSPSAQNPISQPLKKANPSPILPLHDPLIRLVIYYPIAKSAKFYFYLFISFSNITYCDIAMLLIYMVCLWNVWKEKKIVL